MSVVSFITKRVSQRPIIQERLLEAVNKEIVPALRDLIALANKRVYTTTFGDGVETSFTITHDLGTLSLLPLVRNTASGLVTAPSSITFDSEDTVTIVMGAPPAADELTLVLMR